VFLQNYFGIKSTEKQAKNIICLFVFLKMKHNMREWIEYHHCRSWAFLFAIIFFNCDYNEILKPYVEKRYCNIYWMAYSISTESLQKIVLIHMLKIVNGLLILTLMSLSVLIKNLLFLTGCKYEKLLNSNLLKMFGTSDRWNMTQT
jgi:hypothetical protein